MQKQFVIPGEPKGKGRPRFDPRSHRTYTPKDTVNYEETVKWGYVEQCRAYRFPDDAMLSMTILAYYGIPKSKSKKIKEEMLEGFIRPTKKPDMDNVVKIIADGLNEIAYHDDTQIVECSCSKFYSDEPRVEVVIEDIRGRE